MITKKISYNTMKTGLFVGLVLPVLVMLIFYKSRNMGSFEIFFEQVVKAGILTHLISLCAVPNLLVFFFFVWTNRLQSARGVIAATFIYTILVVIMKFF